MILLTDALQGLVNADTDVFFFFNGVHNEFFDYFMSAFSGKWEWIPLYVALAYVMFANFSWKKALLCLVGVALTITFADQVCATLIRPYVARLRPANLDNPISDMVHIVNNYRGGRYSFPSCHSANTFGLAFYIFFVFRNRWLTSFMMIWALITCYSRIYLGVHYPGDLLAGAIIGLAGAYLMYRLFVKASGYKRPEHTIRADIPIWMGVLTIVGMLVYATVQ
ncbi:phosphatase PAP2 family protein [Bacteroides helcogenes]|uniref:Phosphoesterase PA-phosphatase related protein n=1 Tax=Bacteroides helcogenes (strain ATCC 35417 / DSM 20613 / JCM 6297 / CCUG 15421 / P 36-108) TaxID=693979 RepID=E6SQC1_BACT6|nr:phosphatase PAP2 family protein [Bacteroides helcogenes]ADV44968.1 phosphoesterase PA-phosphatase related protein [Bacteroides helcogenes P 36-108]MDY5239825.1 phosphatase PAP2 family protein [Bacteroides helcogenes]